MEEQELRRFGIGATSASSIARVGRTKELIKVFFDNHKTKIGLAHRNSIDECTPAELGREDIYQYFAGFLYTSTFLDKNETTGKMETTHYAVGSAIGWFNCMVQLCREKYAPGQLIFQNYALPNSESSLLFGKIRRDLAARIKDRLIAEGSPLQEKAIPFTRPQVIDILRALRKKNSMESYELVAIIAADWHTVGRGSEGGSCTYEMLRWDYGSRTLCGDWNQHKVGNSKMVYFPSAADDYVGDFYNSLGCLRVVGNADRLNNFGGDVDNICWVFKQLAYASKPVEIVNTCIKSVSYFHNKERWNIPSERNTIARSLDLRAYSSTSFQSGGADHIMSVPLCNFKHAVAVTGHDHTNVCALFEYVTVQRSLVLTAQRALGNWPNVKGNCGQAPSLNVVLHDRQLLPEADERSFICFIKDLLCIETKSSLDENGHLWILSCTLMASLLQYFQRMIDDDQKHNDIVVATIIQKGRDFKFSLDTLLSFGAAIHAEWREVNHMITNQHDEHTLQAFGSTLTVLQGEVASMKVQKNIFSFKLSRSYLGCSVYHAGSINRGQCNRCKKSHSPNQGSWR